MFFPQVHNQVFKAGPVGHLGALECRQQQRGAYDRLGVFAGILEVFCLNAQPLGQPGGSIKHQGHRTALRQLSLVIGQCSQRPFGQLGNVLVGKTTALVHAEVAVLRHDDQRFK